MEQMLMMRETMISYFKRYETVVLFICKLMVGVFIFSKINNIGYPMAQVAPLFNAPYAFPFVMLMSILFAICPPTVSYGLIAINIGLQISGSVGMAVYVVLFLLCVMFFYVRLAPKESVLILAVYFAFIFRVPYMVPIIAGLYFSLASIIPITIGVFIWYFTPIAGELIKATTGEKIALLDLPSTFSSVYVSVFDSVKGNESWIFTAFIFAMVVIVVFVIARTSIDYAKDIAIGIGGVTCILSFILAALVADVNIHIISMIFLVIVSALLAEVIRFFDIVLDYQQAERVQFEDETNYYVVKVIPKVILTRRKRVVKRMTRVRNEQQLNKEQWNEE